MMLNKDYSEMLSVLKKCSVEFILVGAYAMAAHGYPRSTADIDIWVNPKIENSKRLYRALAEFGAPLHEISEDTFIQKGIIFQIGVAPCRIDIITEISGKIDFEDAQQNAVLMNIENVQTHILSISDLIKNKLSTGRAKDLEDAEHLKKLSNRL